MKFVLLIAAMAAAIAVVLIVFFSLVYVATGSVMDWWEQRRPGRVKYYPRVPH